MEDALFVEGVFKSAKMLLMGVSLFSRTDRRPGALKVLVAVFEGVSVVASFSSVAGDSVNRFISSVSPGGPEHCAPSAVLARLIFAAVLGWLNGWKELVSRYESNSTQAGGVPGWNKGIKDYVFIALRRIRAAGGEL